MDIFALFFLVGCAHRYSGKNAFLGVGQGAQRMSLWNQGGGGPTKVWEPMG
jgi:hypothetical protein